MSENGPREGTRDLPRPGPDAGHRAVDDDSPAGVAYATLSRSLRRRRAELAALKEAGGTAATIAMAYQSRHPLEPVVTSEEIDAAVAEAKVRAVRTVKSEKHTPHGHPRSPQSSRRPPSNLP